MVNLRVCCALICVLIFVDTSLARRSFWRGRGFHEFYGDPTNRPWLKALPAEEWFEQQVDPFNPTNPGTWKQRYFTNRDFFRPKDGPVFLMIGGEGTASPKWMVEGAWVHYAKEFGALCFQVEHRFYGKSHPTTNVTTDDLVYLSSENALADLTFFIVEMKKKYHLTDANRWIAFGGSYPGSLAAWLREKYPHLVHGAISSSGPLLAKIDFREYYDVVTDAIVECREAVRESIHQVEIQLRTELGKSALKDQFHLCDPLDTGNSLDMSNFFENLASIFAGIVQYNGTPRSKHNVDEFCAIMNNQAKGPALNRLAELNKLILDDEGTSCLDYKYDRMIKELQATTWDAPEVLNGTRQWTYQTCKEFGFYQTSDNASLVFGDRFPVEFFTRQCTDIFGDRFTANSLEKSVYNVNVNYGALETKATNVIYIHGSVDPWHTLGLTESNDVHVRTLFINGTAHCANMYEPRQEDLPQLREARLTIRNFIKDLLMD
ncbi:putative serine protease F56F10.1 [Sergentomyia squamirostris]